MKAALLATLILLGTATAVGATGFTSTPGAPDPKKAPGQTIIDDFSTGNTGPAGISYSGSYSVDALAISGVRAPPAGDTTAYFGTPNSNGASTGTAMIDFTNYIAANREFRSLSFYWGSVDSYNTLEVLGIGGSVLATINGTQLGIANGDQSSPATNRRLFLTFDPGDSFRALRLTSAGRAFEIDDVAAGAVPEPSTWAMLLSGMGLVGFAMRRRPGQVHVLS
jgi:hypothetical protein